MARLEGKEGSRREEVASKCLSFGDRFSNTRPPKECEMEGCNGSCVCQDGGKVQGLHA